MPELPEVETVRRGLERQLQGFSIAAVEVLRARAIAWPPDPALFCDVLRGCEVGVWQRRGKYLLAALSQAGEPAGPCSINLRGPYSIHIMLLPTSYSLILHLYFI